MKNAVLVGNNLAILIAADILARADLPVTLVTDNKRMGGHFYGFSAGDKHFDIGVVFLEWLETDGKKPPLQDYNPAARYDWTRYATAASEWVQAQIPCVKMPMMETFLDGKGYPDYVFANRLDVLKSIPTTPPPLPADPQRHPSRKLVAGAYDTLEYAEAAALNHGPEFQAHFIQPFIDKLLAGTHGGFLARYHRNVWAPLFYPETLAAAIKGEPHGLREQPLWTTENGFVGQIARDMLARLEQAPHVKILTSPIQTMRFANGTWSIALEDGANVNADRIALGLLPERAAALLGTKEPPTGQTLSVSVLLALVKREAIGTPRGCLTIVAPDYKAYRLSDQDAKAGHNPEHHRISIEANATLFEGKDPTESLRREIQQLMNIASLDDVQVVKCLTAKNVLPLPEKNYVHDVQDFAATLAEAAPNAKLTGTLAGYGVATLNDLMVQGLMVGEWLQNP